MYVCIYPCHRQRTDKQTEVKTYPPGVGNNLIRLETCFYNIFCLVLPTFLISAI